MNAVRLAQVSFSSINRVLRIAQVLFSSYWNALRIAQVSSFDFIITQNELVFQCSVHIVDGKVLLSDFHAQLFDKSINII